MGCAPQPVSRHQETVRGVFSEILIVGKDQVERERVLGGAFEILREIDAKMNHSRESSEVFRINQRGFEESQEVSAETFEIIEESVKFSEKSGGAFDITLLPLMKLWGFDAGKPGLPQDEAIQALLPQVGSDRLLLNAKKRKVGFRVSGMGIDLGGILKGYACDRVVRFLREQGIEHALVNVGDTVRAFGLAPDRKPWRVGLRHPRDPTRTFKVVTLVNEAVATRGDYEHFFVVSGRRYSDILNPKTGYPADATVAVSVVAPSALLAEELSLSLFVLGHEQASSLASQFRDIRWYLIYRTNGDRFKTLSSEPAV